ncbi:hypothetical protein [Paraburkholderia acidicola]|uniref:Uncharacterized protein n=1 Tax=Paraburkholderia acidicola TaxID=1912599 RepID=A0ABV1LSK7_9BURK|nr:hypothetical protein [Paraburkholderia acidicola]
MLSAFIETIGALAVLASIAARITLMREMRNSGTEREAVSVVKMSRHR